MASVGAEAQRGQELSRTDYAPTTAIRFAPQVDTPLSSSLRCGNCGIGLFHRRRDRIRGERPGPGKNGVSGEPGEAASARTLAGLTTLPGGCHLRGHVMRTVLPGVGGLVFA